MMADDHIASMPDMNMTLEHISVLHNNSLYIIYNNAFKLSDHSVYADDNMIRLHDVCTLPQHMFTHTMTAMSNGQ